MICSVFNFRNVTWQDHNAEDISMILMENKCILKTILFTNFLLCTFNQSYEMKNGRNEKQYFGVSYFPFHVYWDIIFFFTKKMLLKTLPIQCVPEKTEP